MLRFNPLLPVIVAVAAIWMLRPLATWGAKGAPDAPDAFSHGMKGAFVAIAILEIFVWISRWFGCFGGPVPV